MSNKPPEDKRGQLEKLFHRGLLTLRLMFDGRVDGASKFIPVLAVLYVLSPIDFIPEIALGPFGLVDDIGILLLGLEAFIRLAPSAVVQEHLDRILGVVKGPAHKAKNDDIIEGEYIIREK
jgi:uncharacterized membrane protein YkvA (DUF1232 family)